MRKIIMMAVAGFIWRQVQARIAKRPAAQRELRRT